MFQLHFNTSTSSLGMSWVKFPSENLFSFGHRSTPKIHIYQPSKHHTLRQFFPIRFPKLPNIFHVRSRVLHTNLTCFACMHVCMSNCFYFYILWAACYWHWNSKLSPQRHLNTRVFHKIVANAAAAVVY